MGPNIRINTVLLSKHYKDIIQSKVMTESVTLEALMDSIEILSNPKTMEALHRSDLDIKNGRVKEVTSIEELLRDCPVKGTDDADKTIR